MKTYYICYILQESEDNFYWVDLYKGDLRLIKSTLLIYKRKRPNNYFRIVRLYV